MKLLYQTHSPFARKVLVAIYELGLSGISVEHQETSPTNANAEVFAANPLGKVPVLLLDDGEAIYDSSVICEYLDAIAGGSRLIPSELTARIGDLRLQALASGICEAGIAVRWETERRPEAMRYDKLRDGQLTKITVACRLLEGAPPVAGQVSLGTIALGTALDWLEFRNIVALDKTSPRLAAWLRDFCARPAMRRSSYAGATQD